MWRDASSNLNEFLAQLKPVIGPKASNAVVVDKKHFFSRSITEDSSSSAEALPAKESSQLKADNCKSCRCNIAISKEILEAAAQLPSRGGALGSLLSLLLRSKVVEHRLEMLGTLDFLLTDNGNRRTFLELSASPVILAVMSDAPPSDPINIPLLILSLRTLCNLVGQQESEKRVIWQNYMEDHPLLTILSSANLKCSQLSEVLTSLGQLAFERTQYGLVLIQPDLLLSLEGLLHPLTDNQVLLQAMAIVRLASMSASCADLSIWTRVLFRLVPLLVGRSLNSPGTYQAPTQAVIEMALTSVINLAERSKRFRDGIAGAGFILPLLSLLQTNVQASIRTSAALILATLAETSSLARTQLSRAVPIKCILGAISTTSKDQTLDATVGLLVTLSQLASSSTSALLLLRQMGAIHTMKHLAQDEDCEIAEEAGVLLDLLSATSVGKGSIRRSTYDWQLQRPPRSSDALLTITIPSTCISS